MLVLTVGWLNSLFSVSNSAGFNLVIPLGFSFYLLVDYIVSCIVPTALINWLFVWLTVQHSNLDWQIRIFKKSECTKIIPLNLVVNAAYLVLSTVLLALFFWRGMPTFWDLNFSINDGNMIIISRQHFDSDGILGHAFIVCGVFLILYAIFQPKLKITKQFY